MPVVLTALRPRRPTHCRPVAAGDAAGGPAVAPLVAFVVGVGSPAKVHQPVVGLHIIPMQALHPLGAGADESFKDQLVYSPLPVRHLPPEVTVAIGSPRHPTVGGFHPAEARHEPTAVLRMFQPALVFTAGAAFQDGAKAAVT